MNLLDYVNWIISQEPVNFSNAYQIISCCENFQKILTQPPDFFQFIYKKLNIFILCWKTKYMFQLFAKWLCLMSMRMSHRRGLECDTAPHGQWSPEWRRCQDAEHSLAWSRHFLVCTLLTPHSGSQQSLEFLSVTWRHGQWPGPGSQLASSAILSIWSSRLIKRKVE